MDYRLSASVLEIYNEAIFDLLAWGGNHHSNNSGGGAGPTTTSDKLDIKEGSGEGGLGARLRLHVATGDAESAWGLTGLHKGSLQPQHEASLSQRRIRPGIGLTVP